MKTNNTRWVTVMASGDPFLIAIAKSLLNEAEIPFIARGEVLQDVTGAGRFGFGFHQITDAIELNVPTDLSDIALQLFSSLEEYPSLKHA